MSPEDTTTATDAPAPGQAPDDVSEPVHQERPAGSDSSEPVDGVAPSGSDELTAVQALAAERLDDLQRLQAEYVNYRRRVDRDRDVARDSATSGVLEALLPVLDDVHLARQHGDLVEGPFAAIAEKLEAALNRLGLERYGEAGEAFDPAVHEALIHAQDAGVDTVTVTTVLQPGYRLAARVLRPARVAVAGPA